MMAPEAEPVYPGASQPEAPTPETLKARVLAQGGKTWHDPAAGLGTIKQGRLIEQMGGKPVETVTEKPNFADRPRITPSVQNIRERIAQTSDAEAQPNRPTPDSLEDKALQQEMNQDLERHGWAADAEARREFIARNSTGVTKSELTGAAEKPVKYSKTPGVPSPGSGGSGDLTDLLRKSLKQAMQKGKPSGD